MAGRLDGVLGLGRSVLPGELGEDASRGVGPLFVKNLAEAGLIEKNIFAFYLESYDHEINNSDVSSFVDIGQVVDERMKPGHSPVWFDLVPTMYWMVDSVSGMRLDRLQSFSWLKHQDQSY